jgi:hypothetical protein
MATPTVRTAGVKSMEEDLLSKGKSMSKYPLAPTKRGDARALRKVEDDAVDVLRPASSGHPFFSFRYSYTEMSVQGGKAHVKSRKARFEDGKLTSEAFEGELDRNLYDRSVSDAQRYFAHQTALFLKSLSLFLPFSRKHTPDRD